MTHVGYILAAYVAAALILLGMLGAVLVDLGAQKRKLARIEAAGLRRRPETAR